MTPPSKDKTLQRVARLSREADKARARADRLTNDRNLAVWEAQQEGATYDELALAMDKTRDRVNQILQRVRSQLTDSNT